MKQTLRISRKSLTIAKVLYFGGLLAMLCCIPALMTEAPFRFLLLLGGFAAGLIGALWLDGIYRCPYCGRRLLVDRRLSLLLKPVKYCPDCGAEISIVIE